ncbi:phosphoribosylanthranilate isomerase [Winogradskyella aurantiaca]|uniref:phosphoribosylanthranilate isomerase n=1 Tax=Winogradskyella aurantiaca TaxID=2219558 RepID=UPI000E1DEA7B|nr:phosphoribosylanthranilate isomerase [Winogradskyella aurantiaca]
MKLKVCGMKYEDNMKAVAALQPDFMGFIFFDRSSRFFESQIPQLPESIKKVGVFVDAPVHEVKRLIKTHSLDMIQLHGKESPEYCNELYDVEIIKVFSIKDAFDFNTLIPYETVCDFYLFDTKGQLPGGNGYSFNWNVLEDYPSTKPYFLSGGIGLNEIENVKEFLKKPYSKYCYAIDVNSKFELKPGLKNTDELEKFRYELQR